MRYLLLILTAMMVGSIAHAKSDDKNYDFRFSPLGLLVGAVEADLNIAIDPNWTLGPQLGFLHHTFDSDRGYTSDYDVRAVLIGLRANWFRNKVFTDGLYVGPSLQFAGIKITTTDSTGPESASANLTLASCLVGYGWFWDSFNIMLGGGLTVGLGETHVTINNSNGTQSSVSTNVAGLAGEFALGWTF